MSCRGFVRTLEFIFLCSFQFEVLLHCCVLFIPESEGGTVKTPPAAAGPGADSELQEPAPGSEAAFGSPASHEAAEGEEESPGGEADPLCEMEARDID